ncbi:MAG: hypothetical protein LC128_03530 [Chitinophagales bacterium]|nr:hypothetical protein [Chitinophagales bacterium]
MNLSQFKFTGDTTIKEAIEILKKKAEYIGSSKEAEKFYKEHESWSTLFREEFPEYKTALAEYKDAEELNAWLNGKNPEFHHMSIDDCFRKMSDQERLSLFHRRVNSNVPSLFDEWLRIWWINRY